ncbi:MAG: aminodeoxychorismate synthase component I [Candidatus Omnitrophota bacterium]
MLRLPNNNFVLLETNRFDEKNSKTFLFTSPIKIISCKELKHIRPSLEAIEQNIHRGYYASGFISYEAGFSTEESLIPLFKKDTDFPLLWFGIYKDPLILNHRQKLDISYPSSHGYSIKNIRKNIRKASYVKNVNNIKEYIRKGETYQVNYTFKYKFDFSGSLFRLYEGLKAKQSVSYSSLIKTSDFSVASFSPELFFRKSRNKIEVRPMKGTFDRGMDLKEDRLNEFKLQNSPKNRSENIMIVDLLRSDLGRISRPGTVRTKNIFEVEKYETLFQMVSTINSTLKKDISIFDLFRAVFPSGSVTGAPKISTMKIIKKLEKEPRRIYTGSIGFFAPGGDSVFNVAIRTILINNKNNRAELGIGSGIVYDSDPHKEFEECDLKKRFIEPENKKGFELIETMLWEKDKGYYLLKFHLERIASSAEYFGFDFKKEYILKKLGNIKKRFNPKCSYRIRLALSKNGDAGYSVNKIDLSCSDERARFSSKKVFSGDIFLYHKTTNRLLYDSEYKKALKEGYFDHIFTNEKKEVTEGCISNIIIKKGKYFYTPPTASGLLNGVFRRFLLENKKINVIEKILYKKDILKADKVYMINSVRGMVRVAL